MNLLRAASTVSLLTLASRVTGLARELIVAASFGASAWTDAFNIAFRIPNLLRRLFAEGAFSQAFVPILAEVREREGDAATRRLVDAVATVLAWALLVVSVLGVLAAPLLVLLLAAGLRQQPDGFDAAVVMTRMMFPYIFFMSLVALAAGILNTWKRFAVPAATPVLLNLAMIGAALVLTPALEARGWPGIYALAIGVMVGGVLQLGTQVLALHRLGLLPRVGIARGAVRDAWRHPGMRRVLRQMAPAVLGVSVAQISLIINTQIASFLGAGRVSWLVYADRLMEFPIGLLGVALGVVLLPQLSAAQAQGSAAAYSALLDWGLRLVVMLAVPCALALLLFAQPLVSALYHYGAFTAHDVDQTVVALMGYGVGVLGLVAVKVLAPGFYAQQDIRTPVRIAIVVLVLTQVMNAMFVPFLGHAGLALAIGVGALINAGWLLVGLRRRGSYRPEPGWGAFGLRVAAGCAALAACLAWGAHGLDWVGLQGTPWQRLGWLALAIGGSVVVYFGMLAACGMRLNHFMRRAV